MPGIVPDGHKPYKNLLRGPHTRISAVVRFCNRPRGPAAPTRYAHESGKIQQSLRKGDF